MKRKGNKKSGFMMIEIIVVTTIIIATVLIGMSITQKSINVARRTFHTSQASFLLEEGAEALRIIRDNSWANISELQPETAYYPSFSSGSWTLSGSPSQIGIFTRTVTISNVSRDESSGDISILGVNDPGTKLITVNVSWSEGGVPITKTLSFYLLDIFS